MRVLDAQCWGVPQRRRRIFLVADFAADGRCAGEILFEREGMYGHLEKSEGAREGTARGTESGTRIAIYDMIAEIYGAKSFSEYEKGQVATRRAAGGTLGGGSENLALCVGNGQMNQSHLQENAGALNCMHDQQIILTETAVRRLTPTECERLQGLPDDYTAGGSDTARYKALGNGMAQPCADYVIRRIVEVTADAKSKS